MNLLTVPKIRHAVADFAESSTIHGLKDIKNASNVTLKVVWIIALCGSMAMFGYQTQLLLNMYLEQKTAVSINSDLIDENKYQSVVYCSEDWIDLK